MQQRLIAERYELESPLGQGGMAQVWRARDLRLDRPVAVKVLDQPGLTDPEGIERFRREAQAVARIAHPNIVSAYDYGSQDGRPYLVMELVAGETLDARLARGPMAVPEAMHVAAQACAALEAAHRAGVVHRDIKPANLIITPDGTVKVLDFGIARLQDAATQAALTRPATVIGTSHYMAPEQAAGASTDPRTDLYAMGCVLYAALTGSPPFPGDNPMGVLYQHLNAPPPPLRERRPDVPPPLDQLVAQLLAKQPAERPADAAEVRARLLGMAGGTSVMPAALPAGGPPTAAQVSPATALASAGPVGRASVPQPAPPQPTGYLPLPPPGPAPRAASGNRWLLPAVAAVAGGLLTLLLVMMLIPDNPRTDAANDPAPGGSTPTATGPASPSPSPTQAADDPAGRLAQLRDVLTAQVSAGQVQGDAAQKLNELLDKTDEELSNGNQRKAAENVNEFRRKLLEFARDGQVSRDALLELDRSAEQLAQLLPRAGGGKRGKRGWGDGDD